MYKAFGEGGEEQGINANLLAQLMGTQECSADAEGRNDSPAIAAKNSAAAAGLTGLRAQMVTKPVAFPIYPVQRAVTVPGGLGEVPDTERIMTLARIVMNACVDGVREGYNDPMTRENDFTPKTAFAVLTMGVFQLTFAMTGSMAPPPFIWQESESQRGYLARYAIMRRLFEAGLTDEDIPYGWGATASEMLDVLNYIEEEVFKLNGNDPETKAILEERYREQIASLGFMDDYEVPPCQCPVCKGRRRDERITRLRRFGVRKYARRLYCVV